MEKDSIGDVIKSVQLGTNDFGIIPFENSTYGIGNIIFNNI
jgi:prephenate dehydratase